MTSAGRPPAPRSVRSAADWPRGGRHSRDGPVAVRAIPPRGGKQHLFAWEFSAGLSSWDEAPVPGQVGKRLFEGLFQKKLPPQRAELVSNITHWAYGMLNGALYGIAAESLGPPRTWYGLPFGAGVWAVDYAVLPAAGLYKPIRDYDRQTLAKDLSAHLVYGTTAAAALRLLSPLTKHPRHG